MRILICGAGIAGPVLAYWLHRYGFEVTVVERARAPRMPGGHAVDLFRPALEVSERMGVLPDIEARATGYDRMTVHREGRQLPADIDLARLYAAAPGRHVEIMRDDLCEIYYDATRDHVEYLFADTIAAIDHDGAVAFDRAPTRAFDVVVGADGLHSRVRHLTFGAEADLIRFLGGYLAVVSVPKSLASSGEVVRHVGAGRSAAIYTADDLSDARAVFLWRSALQAPRDARDLLWQKAFLRAAFTGMHRQVDRWLAQLDGDTTFYFDAISQLRLDRWSRRRVTLVGDAGYCPGPAVGGSTSLAVLGAYVLAGELARAGGDHLQAFAAYELRMGGPVHQSRMFARDAAGIVIPGGGAWPRIRGAGLVSRAPDPLSRALGRRIAKALRVHESMPVPDYADIDV